MPSLLPVLGRRRGPSALSTSRRSRRASCAGPAGGRPGGRRAISCGGSSRTPCCEPAMREMFSSISVPPRSLTPQRRLSVAASSPIFTQLACRFGIVLPERQPEGRGVLEVLVARDLLDPVGAPEQRVEGDEAERHELGDPAGPLLELAHDAHVARPAPTAPRCGRTSPSRSSAGPDAVAGLDDLDPAGDRAACSARSAARTPSWSTSAAVPGVEPSPHSSRYSKTASGACPSARTCSGSPSASRRAGGSAAPPPWPAAASARSPRACSRDGCRPACRSRWRRSRPPPAPGPAKSSSATW